MNRSIQFFILGSVLLNLLLIGLAIGHFSHSYGLRPPFQEPPELAELSAEKQALFHEVMGSARARADALRKQHRALKKQAIELLKAEPFDKKAYLALMEQSSALQVERKRVFAEAVASLAERFTVEERAILAKVFRRPPPHARGPYSPQEPEGPPPPPPGAEDGPDSPPRPPEE